MALMLFIVVGQKTVWACVILNMVYYSGCNVVCICSWTEDSLVMCNTKYGVL